MAKKIILRMAGKDKQQPGGYVRRVLAGFQPKESKKPVVLKLKDGTRLGRAMLVRRKKPAYQQWLERKRKSNIPTY